MDTGRVMNQRRARDSFGADDAATPTDFKPVEFETVKPRCDAEAPDVAVSRAPIGASKSALDTDEARPNVDKPFGLSTLTPKTP